MMTEIDLSQVSKDIRSVLVQYATMPWEQPERRPRMGKKERSLGELYQKRLSAELPGYSFLFGFFYKVQGRFWAGDHILCARIYASDRAGLNSWIESDECLIIPHEESPPEERRFGIADIFNEYPYGLVTLTELKKKRGWTTALISKHLGEPEELVSNLLYPEKGSPSKLFDMVRVISAESDPTVSDALRKAQIDRQVNAQKTAKRLVDYNEQRRRTKGSP